MKKISLIILFCLLFSILTFAEMPDKDWFYTENGTPKVRIIVGKNADKSDYLAAAHIATKLANKANTTKKENKLIKEDELKDILSKLTLSTSTNLCNPNSFSGSQILKFNPTQIRVNIDTVSIADVPKLVYTDDQESVVGNKIIIGGPKANTIAKKVIGLDKKISTSNNKYVLDLMENKLVVAGQKADDTMTAATKLMEFIHNLR